MLNSQFLNKITCGDCLDIIPKIQLESIDLVVTSPPYNVSLGENKYKKKGYDIHDDDKNHTLYIAWLKEIFESIHPILKKGGRIAINVGDGKNGGIPTHSDIIQFMTKELGYLLMTTIIWNKGNTSNRAAWGSFMSPSAPSFPTPFEYLLVFAKESKKLSDKGETDIKKEEFIDWSMALWEFPKNIFRETSSIINSGKHPAPFPVDFPLRVIKMLSWKDATILDIFNGAGTTGVASEMLRRKYIGIEISKEYCDITIKRINDIRPIEEKDMFAI